MIPNAFVFLDELPLTPNGKIDRAALPEPSREGGTRLYVAPRNAVEGAVAGMWEDVLGLDQAGVADSFFDLGGHSLLATQVLARIREQFGVLIPLTHFFLEPTVEGLAKLIDGGAADGGESQSSQKAAVPALRRGNRPERIPLSWTQERMWFLDDMLDDGAINNMPAPLRLDGQLNRGALQQVFDALVARQAASTWNRWRFTSSAISWASATRLLARPS